MPGWSEEAAETLDAGPQPHPASASWFSPAAAAVADVVTPPAVIDEPATGLGHYMYENGPICETGGDIASAGRVGLGTISTLTRVEEATAQAVHGLDGPFPYDVPWLTRGLAAPLRLMGHVLGDDPFAATAGGHLASSLARTGADLVTDEALSPLMGGMPITSGMSSVMTTLDGMIDVDNPLKFFTNAYRSLDPRANLRGAAYGAIDAVDATWNLIEGNDEVAEHQFEELNERALGGGYGQVMQGFSMASNLLVDPDNTAQMLTSEAAAQGELGFNVAWGNCAGDLWADALGDEETDDVITIVHDDTDVALEDPRFLENVRLANMASAPGRAQRDDIAELATGDRQIGELERLIELEERYGDRGTEILQERYGVEAGGSLATMWGQDVVEDMGRQALYDEALSTEIARLQAEGRGSFDDLVGAGSAALRQFPTRENVQDQREEEQDQLDDRIEDARDWIEDNRGYRIGG